MVHPALRTMATAAAGPCRKLKSESVAAVVGLSPVIVGHLHYMKRTG